MNKEIIEYTCKHCGNDKSYVNISTYSIVGECTICHKPTFTKRIKDNPNANPANSLPSVHCPYCGSIDVKKISAASKVGSAALWGVFAVGKVSKQWHCNNCKSDF